MSRLPNLAATVKRKSVELTLISRTEVLVRGRPTYTDVSSTIRGMIKPLRLSDIVKDQIDYQLKYKHVVSLTRINIDDIIEYKGERFRCFSNADYSDYGFYKADLEEIKE